MEVSQRFKPGDTAPRTAVYRVYHYAHRLPHAVLVTKDCIFPRCRRCGSRVSFSPMMVAELIECDRDFEPDKPSEADVRH
jgi:hypothetical protein